MHSQFRGLLLLLPLAGCALYGAQTDAVRHQPGSGAGTNATELRIFAPLPGVYTAGQPARGDWASLAARGVATVVDLRTPEEMPQRDEAAEVAAAGMAYKRLPVADAAALDLERAASLAAIVAGSQGPVLVHCASANRAGALVALMANLDGMPADEALVLGREAGMRSTESRVRVVLGIEEMDGSD